MTLNQNQFSITPVKGQMDLQFNPAVITGIMGAAQTAVVPGTCVKMVDNASGAPTFIAITDDSDDVAGVVVYDVKQATFSTGDRVQVAAMRDNVVIMEASEAIARNAKVMGVVTGSKVANATTSNMIIGRAFDKATAAGDLIRVYIDLPGVLA